MKRIDTTHVTGRVFFVLMLSLFACQSTNKTLEVRQVINKPFQSLDVQPNEYVLSCDRDTVVKTETGSTIRIKANTLTDASGQPVKGKVRLNYREFHKATDILISGIPMTFDSAGTTYGFESAGMFRIDARDEAGNPVFIKEGSNVGVDMGSYRSGEDYTFYYMDTTEGRWKTVGKAASRENTGKSRSIDSLKKGIDEYTQKADDLFKPKRYNKGDKILNLDIDYSRIPELKPFHALVWRYTGNSKAMDPTQNTWIYNIKWRDVTLRPSEKNGCYDLFLYSQKVSFRTEVEPVLQGKDLAKAESEYQASLAEFNKIITVYKNQEHQKEMEASLIRSFNVRQFGIYNWDRFYKDVNAVRIAAKFQYDKKVAGSEIAQVYMIDEERNAVVAYTQESAREFCFIKGQHIKLMAVLPDESIAVMSSEEFERVTGTLDDKDNEITFTLRVNGQKMKKEEDVSNLLASL
jgi:hypothetical protein